MTRSSSTAPSAKKQQGSLESAYASAVVRAILGAASALAGAGGTVPRRLLLSHLRGNRAPALEGPRDAFGLLESHAQGWVEETMDRLVEEGLCDLTISPKGGAHIALSPAGRAALKGRSEIPADLLPERHLLGENPVIEERLRVLRRRLAEEEGVSPFVVFPNGVLAALAARRCSSMADLAQVKGMGESRIRKYGRRIVALLKRE